MALENNAKFKEVILKGYALVIKDDIAEAQNESDEYSERFRKRMSRLLGFDISNPDKKVMKVGARRALIAALVAAALMLTGCGVAFRAPLTDFLERVYEDFIVLSFGDKSDTEIVYLEDIYVLGYVPEGFELKDSDTSYSNVYYKYCTADGKSLMFEQYPANGKSFFLNGEDGESTEIEHNGLKIYRRDYNRLCIYIWSDGKHAMCLSTRANLSQDEILKIISELKYRGHK